MRSAPSCFRKQKKTIEQQQKHVAGDGLINENANSFSASRRSFYSGRNSGFRSNGYNQSRALLIHATLSDKMNMPSKLF